MHVLPILRNQQFRVGRSGILRGGTCFDAVVGLWTRVSLEKYISMDIFDTIACVII